MTRLSAGILLGLLLLTWSAGAVAQTGPPLEQYLSGPRGPYRGRVLDAETGKPLAGVVVVAVWRRDRVMPLGGRSEHYAAREALTNADGEWVIDADDVERNAPKRTLRPTFTIFLPGYGRPRVPAGTPRSVTRRFYEGSGDTVELPVLNTKDERRMHLRTLGPYGLSEAPFTEIPGFMRLFNHERVALGLEPYPSSGRQP
jgi:hypothetical protein